MSALLAHIARQAAPIVAATVGLGLLGVAAYTVTRASVAYCLRRYYRGNR